MQEGHEAGWGGALAGIAADVWRAAPGAVESGAASISALLRYDAARELR
jgi:hypothetical protein